MSHLWHRKLISELQTEAQANCCFASFLPWQNLTITIAVAFHSFNVAQMPTGIVVQIVDKTKNPVEAEV